MGVNEQLITAYLEDLRMRRRSPRTLKEYRRTLGVVARWLAGEGVDLVTANAADVLAWRMDIDHLARGTVLTYTTPVRGFFTWCRRAGHRHDNPAEDLLLPDRVPGLPRPIGEVDLHMAIVLASPRVRPWLVLAAYAGLRACEIAVLRRDEILDQADPAMLIIRGKGTGGNGKMRTVALSPYVWTELRLAGLPRRGFVFLRADGKPGANTPSLISKVANEHLRACGLDDSFHALRHRFGTRTLRACGNLRIVQTLLGHASVSSTEVYTAFSNEEAVAAVLAVQPDAPSLRP